MQAQQLAVVSDDRNPIDDEKYDLDDPFRYFRVGEELPGTRDLASTELLSAILPGQNYSINEKAFRLVFANNPGTISISLKVDASPGCGGEFKLSSSLGPRMTNLEWL